MVLKCFFRKKRPVRRWPPWRALAAVAHDSVVLLVWQLSESGGTRRAAWLPYELSSIRFCYKISEICTMYN